MLWVLRNKFDENGGYLLTTAVCSDPDCGDYNIQAISKYIYSTVKMLVTKTITGLLTTLI
jgi:hypothetical protein